LRSSWAEWGFVLFDLAITAELRLELPVTSFCGGLLDAVFLLLNPLSSALFGLLQLKAHVTLDDNTLMTVASV
jgi:hypothetical protein